MSLTFSGAEPQPSLAWQFENSNVDIVTGLTPSAQVSPGPAQLQGSAALVTDAPTSNTAVYFPGTVNDYMNLGTSTPTNFDASTSNVFFEAWINWTNLTTQQRIYGRYISPQATSSLNLYMRKLNDNTLQVSGGSGNSAINSTALSAGVWYHIAFSSIPGGESYVFINGVPGTGTALTYTAHNAGYNTYIGSGAGQYLSGYIRDLRVVQGGVVPVATFTPGAAPFSYTLPSYVTGSGSTVFTLLGQFITYVPGKYNQAIKITNPVNVDAEYISYPISTIRIEEAGFSAACWVNFQALPPNNFQGYFLNFYGTTSTGLANNLPILYAVLDYVSSKIILVYYVANNTFIIPTDYVVSLNTWYHFACTIYGGNVRMYINGVQTTNPGTYNATTYANLTINTKFNLGNGVVGGYPMSYTIDDLRIYNTALTSAQVQSVYSSQGAPAPSRAMPLPKLAWDFNGTTTDYVSGLAPARANVAGIYTSTTPITWPYYNTLTPKYGAGSLVLNNPTAPYPISNCVFYRNLSIPFGGSNASTVCMWFKLLKVYTAGGDNTIFFISKNGGGLVTYIFLGSAGKLVTYGFWVVPGGSGNFASTVVTNTVGIWYHVSLVTTSTSQTIYVNGTNPGVYDYSSTPIVGDSSNIWNSVALCSYDYGATPGYGASVEIDDLRIFDRALTSAQVQAIYNQQGVPGRGASVYSGSEPQPSLAWTFESSNVDYVTNLQPSAQVSPGPAQLQGSAALVTDAPTSNTAVSFPSTGGAYMNLGTGSPINFNINTSNLFVEAWIYFVTFPPAYSLLMSVGTGLSDNYGRWFIAMGASNNIRFTTRDADNSTEYNATSSTTLSTSRWYHIAASLDIVGDNMRTFIDGSLSATFSVAGKTFANPTTTALIGATFNLSVSNIGAYIRDLRVVQGGVVPTTTFTPGSAPFSYASPTYVANMGTTVFTLLGQFITYNPSGKFGSAVSITNYTNATTSYIRYPLATPISVDNGFTTAFWFKPAKTPPSGEGYAITFNGSAGTFTVYFVYNSSSKLAMVFYDANFKIPPDTSYTAGTWYHIAGTIRNGLVSFYVNGSLIGTAGYVPSGVTVNTQFYVGSAGNYGGADILMDDLRIYNTALTAAQVQSVYSSQGAPAPSRAMPLPKLAWDFNGTTTEYMINRAISLRSGWTPTYGTGKYNRSLIFTNQAGVTPPVTDFSCTFPWTVNISQGFTVAFWVKINVVNNTYIIHMGNTGTGWGININDGGSHYINENGTYPYNSQNYNFVIGQWCHVLLSIGSAVSWYKNGAILGSPIPYVASTASVLQNRFWIGSDEYYGFNGELDDLRIFDRALTSAQVQSIYNQQGVPGRGVTSKVVPTFTVSDQSQSPINFQTYRTDGPIPTSPSSPFGGTEGSFAPTILTFNSVFPSTISKLNFDFFSPTSKSFMECWVYVPSVTNYPRIWFRQIGLSGNPSWGDFIFFLNPSPGKVGLILSTSASTFNSFQSSVNYITNSWNHISMSWDNTNSTAYISVNGSVSSQSQSGRTSEYTSSSSIQFGVYFDAGSLMSNFRLVQNATTLPYITNGFTVPTAPLSIYPTGTTALLLRSVSPLTMFSGGAIQSATGGDTVQDIGGYRIHTFTTVGTSTFTPASAGNVEVLVVGGGGGGGGNDGGGGSGGQVQYFSSTGITAAVSVTVGSGGGSSSTGGASSFGAATSIGGGGGGGGFSGTAGNSSAYGGGSGGSNTVNGTVPGPTGTVSYKGGDGFSSTSFGQHAGGGGGGAGGSGVNASVNRGGNGGPGLYYSISGQNKGYGGGGGGGVYISLAGITNGKGTEGGGNGGYYLSSQVQGTDGTPNTGGGGGAGADGGSQGRVGGSGIVIVRYPLPVRLTGTPLFTQLSPSARSSAVGAFSLRAVNGTSAKAVQVRPQGQFPPVAMSSAAVQSTNQWTQTLSGYPFGGAGSYTANCSSYYSPGNLYPWRAFDKTNAEWASGAGADYSAGVATTNTQTSGLYNGAWLQIKLPIAINLYSYSLTSPPNWSIKSPAKWYILGSNDGTTWTVVDSQQTAVTWTGVFQVKTFIPTPTIAYSYYRIVVNEINGTTPGGGLVEISEWILYGAPPNTATDFYADRLGNLLTAPVTGQSLANWLGGATGYVTTWYNQIQPGQDVSATVAANQPTIDPVNKTIVFNGSTHSFSNTSTSGGLLAACVGTGTKYTYTATWNKVVGSAFGRILEHNAQNSASNQASSLLAFEGTCNFSGQDNDASVCSYTVGNQTSVVMRVDNTTTNNIKVRCNGINSSSATYNYATLSLNNYRFVIGRKGTTNNEFFNGTIKNVMVFKDAISDADTIVLDTWQQTL